MTTQLIGSALDRVLHSKTFARSRSLQDFLTFIVTQSLEPNQNLKEYRVGVDALKRGGAFDPAASSIVRVQAFRLRAKLADYYLHEGQAEDLRIDLEPGSYTPVIRECAVFTMLRTLRCAGLVLDILPFDPVRPAPSPDAEAVTFLYSVLSGQIEHLLRAGLRNPRALHSPPVHLQIEFRARTCASGMRTITYLTSADARCVKWSQARLLAPCPFHSGSCGGARKGCKPKLLRWPGDESMNCSRVTVNRKMYLGAESPKPIRSESAVPNGVSERPLSDVGKDAGRDVGRDVGKLVNLELERVLSSRELRGSKALADLLRYCVQQTLANNVQQLKEYWIGVNVFRRGEEFDPAADPIVRVQARRLRHKLESYYRSSSSHEVTIALRKGAYLTEFHVAPTEHHANGSAAVAPIASVAVLPIADLSSDSENRSFCEGLMDELIHALAGAGDLLVVARTSLLQYRNTLIDIRDIGQQLGADAIIEGSVVREASRRRVSIRLIDARTGYALLSWQADAESGEAITAQESLAQSFVSNMKRLVAERRSKFDG